MNMSNTDGRPGAEESEMPTLTPYRSPADLEQMLDGRLGASDPLAAVIRAACGPVRPSELSGLPTALNAFIAMPPGRDPRPTASNSLLSRISGKVSARLFALTAGVVATTGGVALAASAGYLPSPASHPQPAPVSASTTGSSDLSASVGTSPVAPAVPGSSSAAHQGRPAGSGSASASANGPGALPSPNLSGLCRSWLARPHERGQADSNPSFTVLIAKAGGTDLVDGYCTTLLASVGPGASAPTNSASSGAANTKPSKSATAIPGQSKKTPSVS